MTEDHQTVFLQVDHKYNQVEHLQCQTDIVHWCTEMYVGVVLDWNLDVVSEFYVQQKWRLPRMHKLMELIITGCDIKCSLGYLSSVLKYAFQS